ncbi:hypothetical protein [Candidatus Lokiarchaeum ossiferum]|uniref:hypothetical protein n=1 Tax=Candidatus Lokiarchaeum ossiferum TaxID=2951803 RepID=UPI00352E463A
MAFSTVILQVYLIYGLIFILFTILGFKILSRKRTRISITLSLTFLVPAVGILINIIYRTVDNYAFNLIGNKLTIIFSCLGLVNVYSFIKMIEKSKESFYLKKQVVISLVYFVLLLVLLLIPEGVDFEYGGVAGISGYNSRSLDPLDLGVPVWSNTFFIYGIIVSQLMTGLIIYLGVKQYNEMGKMGVFGKKYIQTLIGIILMDLVIIGSFLFNWLNSDIGRTIHLIISLCIVPSAIFLYLGLKQEKKK